MPGFRVPSPSVSSAASTPAQNTRAQTIAAKSKKPHAASRRAHPHKLDKAKAAVKAAAKQVHKTKQLVEPCVAYVGNIGPGVDEGALIEHFSQYGKILSAQIHCCGGVAMTVKPPPASYHRDMKVRQYAMVVFASKSARRAACRAENVLDGDKLIASTVVSDLPEVREKITKRLEDYRARLEPPDARRAQKSALRSLKLEPTVLLDPAYEKEQKSHKRFQVMGLSFQEGIM